MTDQELLAMDEHFDAQEREYRAKLTPEQLREYRLYNREIVEQCPHCDRVDAELEYDEWPDMVGSAWQTKCTCCDYVIESGSDWKRYVL